MSTLVANKWQNPDGTENYKCRAWVNFNGTGTVAIRAAGNVSSITDNGVGIYTVNFTSALPDTNFVVGTGGNEAGSLTGALNIVDIFTTTSVRVSTYTPTSSVGVDKSIVLLSIFR